MSSSFFQRSLQWYHRGELPHQTLLHDHCVVIIIGRVYRGHLYMPYFRLTFLLIYPGFKTTVYGSLVGDHCTSFDSKSFDTQRSLQADHCIFRDAISKYFLRTHTRLPSKVGRGCLVSQVATSKIIPDFTEVTCL